MFELDMMRYHTATHCNALQRTATHATHCDALSRTATHCNTLQRTATHCNALQRAATHCNTLRRTATHCDALQHTATHCNALHRTATPCNTLQRTVLLSRNALQNCAKLSLNTVCGSAVQREIARIDYMRAQCAARIQITGFLIQWCRLSWRISTCSQNSKTLQHTVAAYGG